MQNFDEKVQNFGVEDENFDTESVADKAENAELDPKSARKEAVKDMKRELIMDAAIKVIAREGYANARLEVIAEEAGFSKASIYHYFPDKEALFIHIIIREQRATYDKCVEVVGRGLPFLDTMREFATAFFDRFFGSGKFYERYMGDAPSSSTMTSLMTSFAASFIVSMTKHEELLNASMACKRETLGLLTQVVAKAKKKGVLTIPIEDEVICYFIMSFFQTYIMESLACLHKDGTLKVNFDKAVDSLVVFFEPWIRDEHPHKRRNHA